MNLTLLTGFSAIAGLLSGYFTARLGPLWALFVLWGVAIVASVLFYGIAVSFPIMDPFAVAFFFAGGFVPFTGCALLAGALGVIVRRTIGKDRDE